MTTSKSPAAHAHSSSAAERDWRGILASPGSAAVLLILFWIFMVASLRDKSLTYDEVAHAAAGYSYWHYSDYRLQPENGQLPQRMAGLPMALSVSPFPAPDPSAWKNAEQWQLGEQWLYRSGSDATTLGAEGRICCGLFAVVLGALVWAWSRRLFGPTGGMVSLLLFVMNPTVLANGALMTSDMAAALFFAASAWGMWAVLNRMTLGRVLLSALLLGGLFLSKVSALLVMPMAFLLIGARLLDGRPLAVSCGRFHRDLTVRAAQTLAVAVAVFVHALVVIVLLWASYGFRYSAFSDSGASGGRFRMPWEYLLAKPDPITTLRALDLSESQRRGAQAVLAANGATDAVWSNRSLDAIEIIRRDILTSSQRQQLGAVLARPSPVLWVRLVEVARRCHLLPEAWIYGFTDVYRRSQVRPAFLNGDFRLRGWPCFFPYTFLVKTPLAMFGVIILAFASVDWRQHASGKSRARAAWSRLYTSFPLWVLLSVYWAAAIVSHLNIGHRHLLPIFAPMFVLCGAAALWIDTGFTLPQQRADPRGRWGARAGGLALGALLVLLAVDTVRFFPNYLAYFNGIVGSRHAYRHLVDSSLDWGQDLPSARTYLEQHPATQGGSYLSYFGTASPDYYGINAHPLFSVAGLDSQRRPDWKNIFMEPDSVAATLPGLRQEWPDHDVIGVQRVGDLTVATLLKKPERLRLGAGTYLISASMLQPVNFELSGPWGSWNERYEKTYQELSAAVKPLMESDLATRKDALVRRSSADWEIMLNRFEEYRFGRLTAFLRQREPDDEINFTILVYRLSAADLTLALDGPPPELGPDYGAMEKMKLPAIGTQ